MQAPEVFLSLESEDKPSLEATLISSPTAAITTRALRVLQSDYPHQELTMRKMARSLSFLSRGPTPALLATALHPSCLLLGNPSLLLLHHPLSTQTDRQPPRQTCNTMCWHHHLGQHKLLLIPACEVGQIPRPG